jgi:regulatory protein
MKPPRSLKARALQMLAQREQSRAELRRKLMPHAIAEEAEHGNTGNTGESGESGEPGETAEGVISLAYGDGAAGSRPAAEGRVDALLDWLEANRYLSQERFVESRVHARAARFGNLRIRQELAHHQAVLSPEVAQALRDSELERARVVHARKFQNPPSTAAEHAKQARFLAGRGFSPDTIRRVLRRTRRPDSDLLPAEFPAD